MVFSSLNFLFVFLPITLILYFLAPFKIKNIILLIASIIFYAWGEPIYVILMLLSISFNYVAGRQFEGLTSKRERKWLLVFAVTINILMLGLFKYASLFVNTVNSVFQTNIAWKELLLPIGISFYTFQALSYVIDVYRQKVGIQKNFINFGTYITMFPQLIAGPIVRYDQIEKQLESRTISLEKAGSGMQRFLFGLGKKVLLANNLGLLYSAILALNGRSFLTTWLGAVAYSLQVYFDFSGYSDMAIGMGKMLGFDFSENFNYPFISTSVSEFWRRWHISLGSWFREYVYIPLGGNRVGSGRLVLNLLIVWALTGLWHGANWNFVIWGLYYGIILIIERLILKPYLDQVPRAVGMLYTLLLVIIGFTIFSNTDFTAMGLYLENMVGINVTSFADSAFLYYFKSNIILLLLAIFFSLPIFRNLMAKTEKEKPYINFAVCAIILVVSISFLVSGSYNPFLYFRF